MGFPNWNPNHHRNNNHNHPLRSATSSQPGDDCMMNSDYSVEEQEFEYDREVMNQP